jgi:hypothetical protein
MFDERNHAVVVAFGEEFNKSAAEAAFDAVGEVRVLLCDDQSALEWCVEQGVEWLRWTEAERVLESLQSTVWPNREMKNNSGQPSGAISRVQAPPASSLKPAFNEGSRKRKEMEEEEQVEILERLMSRARDIKDNGSKMTDDERRRRAAETAEEMIRLLGIDEDEQEYDA